MDSHIREIVSLQIGHYSNFIGSHWLNLQESSFIFNDSIPTDIEHDYLFRDGKLYNNTPSYTPRLLIIDTKGSLRTLPQTGLLYEPPFVNVSSSQALWSGDVTVVNQPLEEKNDYLKFLEAEDFKYAESIDEDKDICSVSDESCAQTVEENKKVFDLTDQVNVWSDFLGTHLHPKTMYIMNEMCHQDIHSAVEEDRTMAGWNFQDGVSTAKRENTAEEINDRIRLLAESCGSLQGFHLLCDAHDGMGGVGAMVAELIADDYTSKDLFSFLSHPPHYKPKTVLEHSSYLINLIQCYTEITKHSSFLLPLNLRRNVCELNSEMVRWPFISFKENCAYENSSIFAAFLETITVPWRSKSNPVPMSYIAEILTPLQRKVVGGGVAFPIGVNEDAYLNEWLAGNSHIEMHKKIGLNSICGIDNSDSTKTSEVHSVRGISSDILERINIPKKRMKFASAWQFWEHYIAEEDSHHNRRVLRLVSGARDPLKTGAPFPHLFNNDVSCKGYISTSADNTKSNVESCPSIANMYQGEEIAGHLRNLSNSGGKVNVSKLPELLAGKLEKDVWTTIFEEFLALTNTYQDNRTFVCMDDLDSD